MLTAECLGGPLDGQARPVVLYGPRWAIWSGVYRITRRWDRLVYRWEPSL